MTAFVLRGAAILGPRGQVVDSITWSVPDRAVTVLLGPAGAGKSALLRALGGSPAARGFVYDGLWRHRGRPLHVPGEQSPDDIAHLPQRPAHRYGSAPGKTSSWQEVLSSGKPSVLLDEPRVEPALEQALRAHTRRGAAVVVTHDLSFARRIADHGALLVAGALLAHGRCPELFEQPRHPLARRFFAQGNCWPGAGGVPELPPHFCWILPDQLAGMGRPGLLGREEDDLEALSIAGIKWLVSLTERPYSVEQLRPFGIAARHFPIPDMGVPAIGPTARLCAEIERALGRGERVAVHCHAGLGRTGTMLAAVLVWLGHTADEAVSEVRATGRGYIQNDAQLAFVRRFAEEV